VTVEVLDIEQFNNLVFEKYNYKGNSILKEKIHYFSCENTTSCFCSKLHLEHLRFIVAYNEKDIIGICMFAYWDLSEHYAISYLSTHKDYLNQGVAKAVAEKLFQYFKQKYPNDILGISGYFIDGWKYLRKYFLQYSHDYNVKIDENPIEYVTEWSDENRRLFEESREIIKPKY
jgi:GNAT superfamily N-acetyltransferase